MSKKDKEPTELAKLRNADFPGKRFSQNDLSRAGRILKCEGLEEARAFLQEAAESKYDFKPPARCQIVAMSRPYEEWSISKASAAIQEYVYRLTKDEFSSFDPGTSKEKHQAFLEQSGIDIGEYSSVQGFNVISKHAIASYEGSIKKIENRNKKRRARLERINEKRLEEGEPVEEFEEEPVFDAEGHLIEKLGVNNNIYCYNNVSPCIYGKNAKKDANVTLPKEYSGYRRGPNDPIQTRVVDRLSIPEGEPGYIPKHQRASVTRRGRFRKHFRSLEEKCREALLAVVNIQGDWVVLDMRGLLREVHRRKLAKEGLTLEGLLNYFSGDPVIQPNQKSVQFLFKEGVVPIKSLKNPYITKNTKKVLEDEARKGPVIMASIDLGQTNPIAVRVSRISLRSDELESECVGSLLLPDSLKKEMTDYRRRYDLLRASIREQAILTLTEEQQAEVTMITSVSAEEAKREVCEKFGIAPNEIPWDSITSTSTYIAEAALKNGCDENLVRFRSVKVNKKGKEVARILTRRDAKISLMEGIRPKLSKETREALDDAQWVLQRESSGFAKLSRWKKEFCRRCVNYVVKQSVIMSGGNPRIIVNIEDLNPRFFHGCGKSEPGWEGLFKPRKENRWFIADLYRTFVELGPHKGIIVFKSRPERTSTTCPDCGHVDKNNRDGEHFRCTKCDAVFNTDLEVATRNLEVVALTSRPMPKGEKSSDAKNTRGARRAKNTTKKEKGSLNSVAA